MGHVKPLSLEIPLINYRIVEQMTLGQTLLRDHFCHLCASLLHEWGLGTKGLQLSLACIETYFTSYLYTYTYSALKQISRKYSLCKMGQVKVFISHQVFWVWGGLKFLFLLTHFTYLFSNLAAGTGYSLYNSFTWLLTLNSACLISARSPKWRSQWHPDRKSVV